VRVDTEQTKLKLLSPDLSFPQIANLITISPWSHPVGIRCDFTSLKKVESKAEGFTLVGKGFKKMIVPVHYFQVILRDLSNLRLGTTQESIEALFWKKLLTLLDDKLFNEIKC